MKTVIDAKSHSFTSFMIVHPQNTKSPGQNTQCRLILRVGSFEMSNSDSDVFISKCQSF